MAGEIQIDAITALTASGSDIVLNNVNTATNRTNLGLGSMATQDATAVALTGGSIVGTEFDLKSAGTSVYKSDGTTAVITESSGTVTIDNATLGSNVTFPSNHLIGFGYGEETSTTGDINSSSTGFQSSGLQGIIFGTEINVGTVLDGQKVIFSLMGGQAYFNSNNDGQAPYYNTSCGIAYNTDNTTPTTSSTRVILWSSDWVQLLTGSSSVSPCGSYVIANSSGSSQTIKIKFWLGSNTNFSTGGTYAHWDGSRTYNPIRYQYYILSA